MPAFIDKQGRRWALELTAEARQRLEAAGVCPGKDPETIGRMFWALVQPQAEARGIGPEEFARIVQACARPALAAFQRAFGIEVTHG